MPGPVPSYRHHKASGNAVVTLNGRDLYLGPWDAPQSRQEYDRLVAEWLANGRRPAEAAPQEELTVIELVAAYLEFAGAYYVSEGKPTKEYLAMRDVLKPLVHLYGRTLAKHHSNGRGRCDRSALELGPERHCDAMRDLVRAYTQVFPILIPRPICPT